jgi:hypothetical protein
MLTDTDFHPVSMAQDASRPCAGARVVGSRCTQLRQTCAYDRKTGIRAGRRFVSTVRLVRRFAGAGNALAGVSAAIGLTFDDPFGELNQHTLGSMIP